MHIIFILIGAGVGAWAGDAGEELLGMLVGVLLASLLYRLSDAQTRIERLAKRLGDLEQRQPDAIPAKPQQRQAPAPISLYEPTPATQATPADIERPINVQAAPAPKTIVHPRVLERPAEPGPFSHVADVAKRWMTTGNVPVKVGVIICFFGVAFLLKYAVENTAFDIPISVRYLIVAAFAIVSLQIGWRLRLHKPAYALSLQGGGIGVLFLTVFAAFQLHDLLPPIVAFGILVLITVAAGALAVLQESRALAILGTTGGFLAPILVSTGSGDHVALFSYYLILNVAVLGVAWVRAWRELNLIGFGFTFGVGTLWGFKYYVPELFASTEPFLVAHFLFYTAIAVLFAFRQRPTLRGFVDGTLVFGTPTIAFALQTQLLPDSDSGLAISAAVVGAFYAALALWLRRTQTRNFNLLATSFIMLAVGFATIAIPLAMDDRWTAIAWALEGAALVWIGVRQNGTLARLAGAGLAVASGVAFLISGWNFNNSMPFVNGNYFGGTLIALSSLVSARMLNTDSRAPGWQGFVSVFLLVWGLLWWFATGSLELMDHAGNASNIHYQLFFFTASFAAMAFLARALRWIALQRTTLLFLPFLVLSLVAYLLEYQHLFDGLGGPAWAAAMAAHFWILYAFREPLDRLHMIWHTWGAVFLVAILSLESRWQIDAIASNDVWSSSSGLAVLALGAAAILYLRDRLTWPIERYFRAYWLASWLLIAIFLLLLVTICIDNPGNPDPMRYFLLVNPFDLLSLGGLATGAYAIRIARSESQWSDENYGKTALWLWGGVAFFLATLAVVRGVHHLAGVPWQQQAIMASAAVQTSLTIFWAALGVAAMLLGTKRLDRSLYILGGALMLVVILKLWIIDFQNNETVFGIASFLGVGLMLLAVGYFSPIPPKPESPQDDSVGS